MQIRSQFEYENAIAELGELDVTKRGQEQRLDELIEAIEAWASITGSDGPRRSVGVGDKVQMGFAFPDASGVGFYTIVRMLPPSIEGEAQYKVEDSNGLGRVIGASQIRPDFVRSVEPKRPSTQFWSHRV